MLIKNRAGILKEGRIILLLLIIIEFSYFTSCLANTSWLLRAVFVLPFLFIIPGAILLAVLRRSINNITKLTVEGFFVSTIMSVILTSIMLMLGLPLIPFNYSLAALIIVLSLSIIALIRKIEFKPSKSDTLLVAVTFLTYVVLLAYFSELPRLFTPDETAYIFSARMGILNGVVPPMRIRPDANEIKALVQGRFFWVYLLASFIGSTDLPAYQAGLLGVSFLIMTALASSLLVKNKWLSTAVFAAVIFNPLLFSFSVLTLNDLAISFYAVFSVLFFVKVFSKTNNNVSIDIKNLFYSLLGIIVLTMIKENIMIAATMWIILVCIMLRYKLYKQNQNYKIFLFILLPVLMYELCLDIPYNVSYWILRDPKLARTVFGRFLFISLVESFITMFFAPPWNPTAKTLFTRSFVDYTDYFYRILMPENSGLLVSAIILALPFLILSRDLREKLDETVLTSLVLLSLWLFYFVALSSVNLSDASRYSLWMIPLWIPLALNVLQDIINDTSHLRKLLSISTSALILLLANIWLSKKKGGVYIGYGLPSRLWTANAIMFQLISLLVILSLLFLRKSFPKVRLIISKKLSVLKTLNFRVIVFSLVIIFILLNEVHFSLQFMQSSVLYEDHGLITLNKVLENFSNNENLVFANNYIYMRPYVSDKLLRQGLLLPSPDTRESFLKLLEALPNNTLFLISTDDATNWHVAGNEYIKSYADLNIIFPKIDTSKWSRFNLPESILKINFDDGNKTTIIDYSGFGNNGINYGANIVDGRYGYAASFDGVNDHIRIPNSPSLHGDVITISAWIKTNVSQSNNWIVTKYESRNKGEYLLGVAGNNLRFSVVINGSTIDYLAPFNYYDGEWHHIIGVYDGSYIRIYVDGAQLPNPLAQTGNIDSTTYDVVIGSGHSASGYFFNGFIDEVQVSSRPLNITEFLKSYYEHYATEVYETFLIDGKAKVKLFCNINKEIVQRSDVRVKDSNIFIDKNGTVIINLKIESDIKKEIAIILATERFTKVHSVDLNTGINDVVLEYPFKLDPLWYSYYWSRLGGMNRLIVLDDNEIIFNSFLSIIDLKRLNLILHIFAIMLISGIMFINLKQLS